jgi:hypothetical protein
VIQQSSWAVTKIVAPTVLVSQPTYFQSIELNLNMLDSMVIHEMMPVRITRAEEVSCRCFQTATWLS